jgi:cytidylate kinase
MKPVVLAFSGAIGSGKSTVSKAVASKLEWNHISFGDYIRAEAGRRGLPQERVILQDLGAELIAGGWESFCGDVLTYGSWEVGHPLILDGIRHAELIPILESYIHPLKLYLIYIEADDHTRFDRVSLRDSTADKVLAWVEQHSTEEQVRDRLPQFAHLRLNGTLSAVTLVEQVVSWLKSLVQDPIMK